MRPYGDRGSGAVAVTGVLGAFSRVSSQRCRLRRSKWAAIAAKSAGKAPENGPLLAEIFNVTPHLRSLRLALARPPAAARRRAVVHASGEPPRTNARAGRGKLRPMSTPHRLHICRPGTYRTTTGREITLSAADLAACAAAYDPSAHQAPLVVGHPKTDDPAFGWVSDLAADAAGELTAGVEQVADELRDAVSAGRYRRLSASFFPPVHERNPRPGTWYLRHVGFLGAAEPAVQGLRRAELGAPDDDIDTIDFGAPVGAAANANAETPAMPQQSADTGQTETLDLAAERAQLAADRAALSAERERVQAERAAIDAERATRQAQEIADFAAQIVEQQHYAPHVGDTIRTVVVALAGDAETVDFGAPEDGAAPLQLDRAASLRRLVSALADPANRVPQGEATAPEGERAPGTADFAAPDGYEVPAAEQALHRKATAYAAEKGVDFITAYKAVGGK
jgi:hypothetical protein